MYRSFSDRVLAGVCGGLAASLHLSPWLVRVLWVLLTLVSFGVFAILYVLLWWVVPAESPTQRRRGFPVILVLALVVLAAAAWFARDNGQLVTQAGVNLFYPGAVALLGVVFFLRQVRA